MNDKVVPEFRAFTLKAPGRVNRILSPLRISAAFDPQHPPSPPPPIHEVQALWDTGATGSMVSEETARTLGLAPTGSVKAATAGGERTLNTYLVNLTLPNKVGIAGVTVSASDDLRGFDAIVGMDIISLGDFAITNVGGQTCMSFRYPSVQRLDFVREANEIRYAGVKPNDPCPCGKKKPSGRPVKYKHCCKRRLA